jgi:serine/threonine protein kinase
MGTVFLALDRKLDRQVAMKVVNIQDDALQRRFRREAVGTANLRHPNILPVFDYGIVEDGRPFYTMELVEGQSLRSLIEALHESDEAKAKLRSLLRILCQVCEALSYAGEQGTVHRDLKPDNIMVGEFNQVWVVDWGLATLTDCPILPSNSGKASKQGVTANDRLNSTRVGQVLGTPVYMAPEQARGRTDQLTPLVDVYAAGAVLFEVLSGRAPFADLSSDQVIDQLLRDERPELTDGAFLIPAPLRSVVKQAMAPKPVDRYQTAHTLASDLQHWMDGGPVVAHRETWLERLARLGSRFSAAIAIIAFYLIVRAILLLTIGR